jgi:hypothetical protein
MNLHEYAVKIASREGKKKSISIAQIKEVIRVQNVILAEMTLWQFIKMMFLLRRNGNRY